MIDGKQTFQHKREVTYSDINNRGIVDAASLVDYLQGIAILHSDEIGYTTKWFLDNHLGWALVGWNVNIYRNPLEKELLTIDTWTENYRRVQADRDFQIKDEKGCLILEASSRWFLMDTERRKPARLKEEFFSPYIFENSPPCAKQNYKIKVPGNISVTSESVYTVIRRDTDTNNHAKNVVYIDWAMDSSPDNLYENYRISQIKAVYKKECYLGEQVKCTALIDDTETYFIFTKLSEPENVVCKIFILWQEKD